jgi:hypothetical protein
MKLSLIQKGCFYLGKRQRIREVLTADDWSVEWRDIDAETIDYSWLAQTKGSCSPKTFGAWATRKVEPEEVQARMAMPKSDRMNLSEPHLG